MATHSIDTRKAKASIADYFFLLRPMLHPPVWTIVILGFFSADGNLSGRLWLLLAISSTAASWAYIINQITDIESDRLNRKLFFLPDKIISIRHAKLMSAVMALITIAGGFYLGYIIGALLLTGLVLGYVYSVKPFNFKVRPFGGFLCNSVSHGIMPYMAGYIVAGGEPIKGAICSIPYFFAVGGVFIGTTIPDYMGDKETGKITLAVKLLPRKASFVMVVCIVIALVSALFLSDWLMASSAALSLPFYYLNWRRVSNRNSAIAAKISILILSLAAAYLFWPYIILLIGLILVTRLYYRFRFNMVYPRLT